MFFFFLHVGGSITGGLETDGLISGSLRYSIFGQILISENAIKTAEILFRMVKRKCNISTICLFQNLMQIISHKAI